MARIHNKGNPNNSKPSGKTNNKNHKSSNGKKKTSKAKTARRVLNAYEIATREENHRNAGDSDSEFGSDDDGAIVNPMKKLGRDDKEAEFEDEELDSDEALGSDDDFDVMTSKFSQTIRDKAKKAKSKGRDQHDSDSESEEESDYHSVDEGEFVSLSEVWDLDDADMKKNGGGDVVLADSEESDEDSEEDDSEDNSEDDSEESFPFSDEDSQSENDSDIELTTLKNSLTKKKQRESLKYQTLNIPENELSLPGGGEDISLADMLSVVENSASRNAILIDADENATENSGKPLAIPLPQRIQDRNERRAAYEITKGEVNKWEEVVQANRNKEVVTFDQGISGKHTTASSFASDSAKPFNELEAKINGMLQKSLLLDEKKESTFEQIATAKMSKEELAKRQGELRQMRELMFRQEREAKRIKKIKSKSYRKVKKREMMKNKALIEGEESDDEDHDMRRAQERMTLKHKNNSAWAKKMINSGLSKDSEAREEMEEMLRRGERLRTKVLDRDDSDDEFGDMRDMNIDKEVEEDVGDDIRAKLGKTGVMNMAFMKSAEAKEKMKNEEMRSRLRKLEADGDLAEFEQDESANAIERNINAGRRVYSAGAKTASVEMAEVNKEVKEELEVDQSTGLKAKLSGKTTQQQPKKKTETPTEEAEDEESNPWLTPNDTMVQKSSKLRVVDQNSSKLSKSQAKLVKSQSKTNSKRKASEMSDDEDDVIDMNQTLKIVDKHSTEDSDHEGETNEKNIMLFKQSDLLKQAFAGDDVVREFEEEKKQQIKDEGDHVEDLTLPGWGDWAGSGIKKSKNKKNKKVKVTKGVEFANRQDKFKNNVIINEKINKKNAKYQSSAVPYPFESREQYERSLRMPIGQEWTSRETHQRLTMPKMVVKTGVVINPLKAPFK